MKGTTVKDFLNRHLVTTVYVFVCAALVIASALLREVGP
jgi:hypothetical protein